MRAAVISHFNQPWELRQLPDPRPAAGQVLIRVRASGLCGTDLHVHGGLFPVPVPLVAGHEPVGEIVELGAGVSGFGVGDRVGVRWVQKGCGDCAACQGGRERDCPRVQSWMNLGGANSELMVAWAAGCFLLPAGLDDPSAASILCAGPAILAALRGASPKQGERVAVLGVGGLGHLALQICRWRGLRTLALTGQGDKAEALGRMGADEVIVTGEDPGRDLARSGGADVVLSTTNSGKQVTSALGSLRPGGRLVNLGLTEGPTGRRCIAPERVLRSSLLEQPIDPMSLALGQRPLPASSKEEREDLAQALGLAASGQVKPVVETYPLEQVNTARDRLAAGKVRYRAVLLHA